MSPLWRFNVLGHLWALPLTLIGVLLFKLVYRAHSWRFYQGVLVCIGGEKNGVTRIWGRPGAQTIGIAACFATEGQFARADLRVHEYTHCVQAMCGGVLFGVAYVAAFLWHWVASGFGPWHDAYRANAFEVQAYRIGDKAKGWGV